MDNVKIVVLSDGTWEVAGSASLLTITQDAYDALVDGEIETCDIDEADVIEDKEIA